MKCTPDADRAFAQKAKELFELRIAPGQSPLR
jgi:hypothetical protein